ncbi:MAG: TetR/AcrR family transcriptional regulator [Actinomycetia bacterium]|nr:TetR/AcrR family transcriptional regulator [Actinomycetes bacterium]
MPQGNGKGRATRARLLTAAVGAFAERGYHSTTTRDIAATAGLSPAAVYVHHSTKEEMLYVIAREGHQLVLASLREATIAASSPTDKLQGMMRRFATHHARHHREARVINYELLALSAEHLDEINRLRNAIDAEFRTVVDAGLASGEFASSEPSMAVRALTSLGVDIARWYHDGGRWTPEQVGRFYADVALRLVGGS